MVLCLKQYMEHFSFPCCCCWHHWKQTWCHSFNPRSAAWWPKNVFLSGVPFCSFSIVFSLFSLVIVEERMRKKCTGYPNLDPSKKSAHFQTPEETGKDKFRTFSHFITFLPSSFIVFILTILVYPFIIHIYTSPLWSVQQVKTCPSTAIRNTLAAPQKNPAAPPSHQPTPSTRLRLPIDTPLAILVAILDAPSWAITM